MKKIRLFNVILVFSMLLGGATPALAFPGYQTFEPEASIASVWATTQPSIDGSIGLGEWNNSSTINLPHGYVTVMNDHVRLYFLINVMDDNVDNSSRSPLDYFWLSFDKNKDGAITPNVDINYGIETSTGNMRYQYYLGPASWTGLQPSTFSSRARGFGCFFADGSLSFSLFPFRLNCNRHRVWELGIDLSEIGATPGETVKFGLRVSSPNPNFTDDSPANFYTDFSRLHEITLASSRLLLANRLADVSLEDDAIELTQAIQDRDNTLPLVADKRTVARVYADTDGVLSSQPAKVYLYGSQGGVDLPGSPLAMMHFAPSSINRSNKSHTANFFLPASWDQGVVQFSAKVKDLFGNEDSSPPFNKTFTNKEVPVYWIVPINTGTNASPVVVDNATITAQESYLEAIYPVKDVKFVRKPWEAVGPTTVGNSINALNQYYNNALIAWFITVLFTGNQPFELPDQIYGFTPSGGGLSDPVWVGANGKVARGFLGTSLEGTMAHEINHNLDRDATGTWGRHVPNGCGAGGPDSAWPYANDDIQEVGFDTRGSGAALPGTYPDIMSYCQSGSTPTKWISPYRWNALFNNFDTTFVVLSELTQGIQNVLYLTGQVNEDGSGNLNPVLVQPGLPSGDVPPGDYFVQVLDENGKVLAEKSFDAQFIELEPGERITEIYFNFQLPTPVNPARVVLRHMDQVLDEIEISDNAPTVTINSPNGGETWDSGLHTVEWTAADPDGDPLTYNLLYSNDSGATWFPVAAGLTETSYEVDTSMLAGSSMARFKVIASDGYNTAEDISDADFSVSDSAPDVQIISPQQGSLSAPGTTLLLKGEATDAEDEDLPEEAFIWTEGDKPLGMGREVPVTLGPGRHSLTLTVVDSAGNMSTETVEVLIAQRLLLPQMVRGQ